MNPTLSAAVVALRGVVAVVVARLQSDPQGDAPWIAALASLLVVALAFLAGVTLWRQRG